MRRLALPAIDHPHAGIEPGGKSITHLAPRHALRTTIAKDLGGRGREEEGLIVSLKAERHIKAPKRERDTVAQRGNGRDLEQVEINFGFSFLRPEPFYTQASARAAKVRIEAVAVPVAMVLDFKRGTRREPRRKSFRDPQAKLVKAEVCGPWIGQRWRIPGELGDKL